MKIKFRALCLAALVVVMAFTSAASATQFLAVDSNGKIVVITIDPTADNPMTYTGYTTGTPEGLISKFQQAGSVKHLKMYSWKDKYLLISADVKETGTEDDKVFFYNIDKDGNVTYDSSHNGTNVDTAGITVQGIGGGIATTKTGGYGVTKVLTLNDNPVFIADNAISTVLLNNDYAFVSIDLTSIDTAFEYDSKLYVIHSVDNASDHAKTTHVSLVKALNSNVTADDIIGDGALFKKAENMTSWNLGGPTYTPYAYAADVVGDYVYILDSNDLRKFEAKTLSDSGLIITTSAPTLQTTNLTTPKYRAMTTDGSTIYALKETENSYAIVSISPSDEKETFIYDVTKAQVGATNNQSFDIYYDPTDKVIAVVNHGGNVAFYVNKGENNWSRVTNKDTFITAAMMPTASETTPDTPDTPVTTTTVDINTLDSGVASTIASTMGTEVSNFVTATVASKTSTTSAAEAKVKEKFGDTSAIVKALGSYTPSAEGFILVAQSIAYGKKAYFVDESILAADSTGVNEATLLDSTGAALTSGNSTYVAGGSLDANKAYTLVTAETDTSGGGDTGDTGSSSSGCDAGFGLMSLAALLAVTTISKRR